MVQLFALPPPLEELGVDDESVEGAVAVFVCVTVEGAVTVFVCVTVALPQAPTPTASVLRPPTTSRLSSRLIPTDPPSRTSAGAECRRSNRQRKRSTWLTIAKPLAGTPTALRPA